MPIEPAVTPVPRPRQVLADFGGLYASNAVVAFLFSCTGPVAIILSVGARGRLSEADIASWIFAAFFINGLLSFAFTLAYRQPLVFLWSIPGAVLLGPALGHLTFAQCIGAFLVTGVLLLVLGVSGWVRRAMDAIPMPIVMAMVAGVFLRFGLDLVRAFRDGLWIALPMTAAFLLLTLEKRISKFVPPLIGALVAGGIMIWYLGAFRPAPGELFAFASPILYKPVLSLPAIIELVIPLAVTVLAAQNAQGIAILTAAGHRPPISAITAGCGAGSMLTAMFGSVSTCLTGPVNAVLAGSGDRQRQYTAALLFCVLALLFGLLAPFFTRLLLATPAAFIATLAGLAMLRVLQTAFTISFAGKFSFGALICFLVTVADISILRIGAPFWGLVFGLAASWLLEREEARA
ncbi:MAG: benzoate rane transport protein [Betaproteobacteria bacterium]|jgi:benzoate membrane transport protein|nr:benzoate rane transport protein [Betaproteobacteria bacterium]